MSEKRFDQRWIYLIVLVALSLPLIQKWTVTPARMASAERLFEVVDNLQPQDGKVAFVSLDWGPNTSAENGSQSEVLIEHLFRRRIPVILFSQYALAEPFLQRVPKAIADRLTQELPDQHWEYGRDWVNLGYRPSSALLVQALAKSSDIREQLVKDALGNRLVDIPLLAKVRTIRDVIFLAQITGLVGTFDTFVQFFQTSDYRPVFAHGCTSITVPEAYIYLDSGQLSGLLEGIAGAAWYSELLARKFAGRAPDSALLINTGLGVAHMAIIAMILLGNLTMLLSNRRREA